MKNIGKQKKDHPVFYTILVGLGVAIAISVLFTGLVTFFIMNENLPIDASNYALPLIQFLSAFTGCIVVGKNVRDNKTALSGAVCVSYYVLLIGFAGLFADGISGRFWIGFIATFVGYVCAIFLSAREKAAKKGRKRRKAYS